MLTRRAIFLRNVVVVTDLLVVAAAFAAAYATRSLPVFDRFGELYEVGSYLWALWAALPIWLLSLSQAGFYHRLRSPSYRDLCFRLAKASIIFTVVYAAVLYLTKGVIVSRLFVQIFILYTATLLFLSRVWMQWLDQRLRRRPGWSRQTLLVGSMSDITRMVEALQANEAWSGEFIGALGWGDVPAEPQNCPVPHWGKCATMLEQVLRESVVDEVVFATPPPVDSDALEIALQICERQGVTGRVVLSFGPVSVRARKVLEPLDSEHAVVSFESVPGDLVQLAVKRALDIMAGLAGLAVCGVAYAVVARKIRRESEGPVFFAQERIGLNGRAFRLYKFRTMVVDAESHLDALRSHNEMRGAMFKMRDDPRVTRLGARLRRTHIDELPQFLNVLRGEMSLVGTRPPTPAEVREYDSHHHRRISFKPGLTGLWQIRGNDEVPDFEEVVRLDTEYIDRWSLWLDVRIVAMTLRKVYRSVIADLRESSATERKDVAET